MPERVAFDDVSVTYPGMTEPALSNVDLEVREGEFLVLVGPSGCGKSTFLRALAGLESVSSGRILIGERDVTRVPAKDRDIAMVFQNYALYPHMTVAENMGFALKIAKVPRSEISRRVDEAAALLDLTPYLDRKPKALSGGQRQRVAMGRAIVREPKVFLMDEPLSNLDAQLRVQTRTQIATLQRRLNTTTVYVTHDQVEAMTMGDRVAILQGGVIQQVDTPDNLYQSPVNAFVAGFIGSPSMNLIEVPLLGHSATINGYSVAVPPETAARADGGPLIVGVRPEDLTLSDSGIPMSVQLVEALGPDTYVYGSVMASAGPVTVVCRAQPSVRPALGSTVHVVPERIHFFSSAGDRARLN